MEFKTVPYQSDGYNQTIELRQRILRDPIGLKFSQEDLKKEANEIICVCLDNGKVIGCNLLAPQSNEVVKLRQMAIDENTQGTGIGTKLLTLAEETAHNLGYKSIELHARLTAKNFYLKNGYQVISDTFTEVTLPHVEMKKEL